MISMWREPKIIGACVLGAALVAGAYTISNFGQGGSAQNATLFAVTNESPERVYIEPTDSAGDGIEDWQREYVNSQPIVPTSGTTAEPYTPPDTLTDQVATEFLAAVLRTRGNENMGINEEQVITQTAERLKATVNDQIYTARDVTVIPNAPEAIRTYGNTMGGIILNNNVPNSRGELEILDQALKANDPTILDQLQPLIAMYATMRDQSLATPVPEEFLKEHLDLINIYHALHMDITGMKGALADSATALLRIKRYQDDATALLVALRNMYTAIIPYANLYSVEDQVTAFLPYGPGN